MNVLHLKPGVGTDNEPDSIVGQSRDLTDALELVKTVAPTTASVLITGETGTGKELIARAVHRLSRRRDRPLVIVNCASIPKDLFESEFFGHVKGSFTGAIKDRIGRFELADRGTLFLDEICEIPIELQSKLLRVLQESEFERVGDEASRRVDVRVIAATNRDLQDEINNGRFRDDLYFRLNVVPILVPPLRDRVDDIVLLAQHFLANACKQFDRGPFTLSRENQIVLCKYAWPGNVRELRNVIERAVALSGNELVDLDELLPKPNRLEMTLHKGGYLTDKEFRETEKRNISAALDVAGWRIAGEGGAAQLLGIPPSTLANRLRSLGISRPVDSIPSYQTE